jgi:signal transduction histidine kinase
VDCRHEHKRGHIDDRELAIAKREDRVVAREKLSDEHNDSLTLREAAVELREQALHALAEAEAARVTREDLMVQMREANERLVLATQLRASVDALRGRERKAQASNRAKDEFVAMLGHELRGPLSPILLALEMIGMDNTTDPREREHAMIARQVSQLVRLVDDLLDLSRAQTGKIELACRPLEMADVVARAVETATPVFEAKHQTLAVDVPAGLVVDGDVLRLTQVVGNLLTNAAKYTPSGGSIDVTAQRRGENVRVCVRDNGIGISDKMLPRIFDMFAQEKQSDERPAGGLGLGLSIVSRLVALHGGTVTAHSEGLGHGSEFVIELPVFASSR